MYRQAVVDCTVRYFQESPALTDINTQYTHSSVTDSGTVLNPLKRARGDLF